MNRDIACCDQTPSRAALRRRKLTETARKLFIENGFHQTGMAQIAKESGIAIGQIYRDFTSKEEIIAASIQSDCGLKLKYDDLDHAIRTRDTAAVRTWLHHCVQASDKLDDARMFAESVAECSRNPRIAAVFTAMQNNLRRRILAALTLLVPADCFAQQLAIMTEMIIAISVGALQHQLLQPDLDSFALAQALSELIETAIDSVEGDSRNRPGCESKLAFEQLGAEDP